MRRGRGRACRKGQVKVTAGALGRQSVAVIADGAGDRAALLEALDEWSGLAKRVTGRVPSVVIADDSTQTRGVVVSAEKADVHRRT